jgi:hypothetical protein
MVPWPKWWAKVQYSAMNISRDSHVSEHSIKSKECNATTKAAQHVVHRTKSRPVAIHSSWYDMTFLATHTLWTAAKVIWFSN